MRQITVPMALILMLLTHASGGEATDFETAKAEAMRLNKPLLIDFMTTW